MTSPTVRPPESKRLSILAASCKIVAVVIAAVPATKQQRMAAPAQTVSTDCRLAVQSVLLANDWLPHHRHMSKTLNGGGDWDQVFTPASGIPTVVAGNFVNSIAMDPLDHRHLVVNFHEHCLAPYAGRPCRERRILAGLRATRPRGPGGLGDGW